MKTYFVQLLALFLAAPAAPQNFSPAPEQYRALASISGDSLRGNLSFIASDLLEGRDTPSPGLDIAALYIAAQFRRAGLAPAGDDGYFQTAHMLRVSEPPASFDLRIQDGARKPLATLAQTTVVSRRPLDLSVPLYKVADEAALRAADVQGKVLLLNSAPGNGRATHQAAAALQPAAFVELAGDDSPRDIPRLIDADEEHTAFGDIPRLILRDPEAIALLRAAKPGETGIAISIKLPAPTATPVTVRNVAALLLGSDPVLSSRIHPVDCALRSHRPQSRGRSVQPGANDDGSGTVSVIEIAQALAAMHVPPKRSLVFMTFFGEEERMVRDRNITRAIPCFRSLRLWPT